MAIYLRRKWVATALFTGVALVSGCAGPSAGEQGFAELESSEQSLRLSDLSTGDLVTGLILMDGPAAQLVPTIRDNWALELHVTDPKQRAARREFAGHVVAKLLADYPEQSQAFRVGVLSGDHVTTQQSIEEATQLVVGITKPLMTAEGPANADDGRGLCTYQASALDTGLSFSWDFHIMFVTYMYWFFGSQQGEAGALLSEQVVDEIVSLAGSN